MITLRLFFFGLIAFVQSASQLTVVLVDASKPPNLPNCGQGVSGCAFHEHFPLFVTDRSAYVGVDCPHAHNLMGLCAWNLKSVKVLIPDVQETPLHFVEGRRRDLLILGSKHKLPTDLAEAADFTWVPLMQDVSAPASAFDFSGLSQGALPVAASVMLRSGEVQACHLAERNLGPHKDQCHGNCVVDTFRFESLDGKVIGPQQALADGIMVSTSVNTDANGYVHIVLEGAEGDQSIRLRPFACAVQGKAAKCVDVAITNMPDHDGEPCLDVGIDFALLYQLSASQPGMCHRLVPFRISGSVSALRLPECELKSNPPALPGDS